MVCSLKAQHHVGIVQISCSCVQHSSFNDNKLYAADATGCPTHLLQLLSNVSNLSRCELPVGDEWTGAERVDPVLVPQQVQQVAVQATLEEAHVQAVILQLARQSGRNHE